AAASPATPDVLPPTPEHRAATERAERAGDDRQQAQQIADPPAQRNPDEVFDLLTARDQARARIAHAEIPADAANARIGEIWQQPLERVAVERGVDVQDHHDLA